MIFVLVLASVLALASSAFSALETAVFSMTAPRRRDLRRRDERCANDLDSLLEKPGEVYNTLLLADTLANLPLIVLCVQLLDHFNVTDNMPGWGVAGTVFVIVIVACDLAPKLVALAAPMRTTRYGMPLARRLIPLLSPVCSKLQRLSERLVSAVAPRLAAMPEFTEEELATLIEIGREEGTLFEHEGRIIREVMKLADEPAKHCMTPRVDVFSIPDNLTNAEAAMLVRSKRYRRVPVRGETPDEILGVLDVHQFLLAPTAHYTEMLSPPSFVPETMDALDLLWAFLGHRQGMAFLLDEFGGVEGIVTLSDMVEELLGEEGPDARSELYIEQVGPDRMLASGSARLDDLAEHLGFDAGKGAVNSIGGLVIERFGYLPRPGASFSLRGWLITVRRATRKRIKEVMIERIVSEDSDSDLVREGGGL
jgi:putative hemolysin